MSEKSDLLEKNKQNFESELEKHFSRDNHLYALCERFLILSAISGLLSYESGVILKVFKNGNTTFDTYLETVALIILFLLVVRLGQGLIEIIYAISQFLSEYIFIRITGSDFTSSIWRKLLLILGMTIIAWPIVTFFGKWSHELGQIGFNQN